MAKKVKKQSVKSPKKAKFDKDEKFSLDGFTFDEVLEQTVLPAKKPKK